jgi:hypothetical protein
VDKVLYSLIATIKKKCIYGYSMTDGKMWKSVWLLTYPKIGIQVFQLPDQVLENKWQFTCTVLLDECKKRIAKGFCSTNSDIVSSIIRRMVCIALCSNLDFKPGGLEFEPHYT